MLADRPYSAAMDFERAITELERCAATQFDPQVVAAFVVVARERALLLPAPLPSPAPAQVRAARPESASQKLAHAGGRQGARRELARRR
jgi:HD-GYP domain-containing protein (c-di-GMP phosphodiesterase class II)